MATKDGRLMSGTLILLNLLGGVCLLLWGLRTLRRGLTRAFGKAMQHLVSQALTNRFTGFASGVGVTMLLQSSTATALLVASFATRNAAIQGSGGIAALLGADLGSALVANVIAQGTAHLVPVLFLAGLIFNRSFKGDRVRELGRMLIGLGLMLLALQLIVSASAPLRGSQALTPVLAALGRDLPLAILLGAALAWLAHSSLAIVLLVAILAGEVLGMGAAVGLVVGANVGNAVSPLLATWNSPAPTKRITVANIAMRSVGAIIALPFLPLATTQLVQLPAEPATQVVMFHLLYNLALVVICLPFVGHLARLLMRLLPAQKKEEKVVLAPEHLDKEALESPAVALAFAARDVTRMAEIAEEMLAGLKVALTTSSTEAAHRARLLDDTLDRFYSELIFYLNQINGQDLSEDEVHRSTELLTFVINLEHIGDVMDANMGKRIERIANNSIRLPAREKAQLEEMFDQTQECLSLAVAVMISGEQNVARKLLAKKIELARRERKLTLGHLSTDQAHADNEASTAFVDLLGELKRVISYASSGAYPIADQAGLLISSRLRDKAKTT